MFRATVTVCAVAVAMSLLVPTSAMAATTGRVHWLCLPSRASDDCRGDLATTIDHRDGSHVVVRPHREKHPRVDCFYVYPTSSQQPTPNSDGRSEASVRAVVRQQAARFSSLCRMYVPLYRQRTLAALSAEKAFSHAQRAHFYRVAYADVLTAWRAYLRRYNHGRGVIVIGHSQGSRLLRKLLREQVDNRPGIRSRLVSAVLPGADVLVRRHRDRGGDFRHLPLCRSDRQTGCVMAWSTFNRNPPDDTRFGRSPSNDDASPGLGLPYGPQYRVACTNPASLARDRRAPTHALARSEMFPGVLGLLLIAAYGGPPPTADTPYLVPSERYSARCVTRNHAHVLLIRSIGDARRLNPEPNDTWGLHLFDINLFTRDLLHIMRRQIDSYQRGR